MGSLLLGAASPADPATTLSCLPDSTAFHMVAPNLLNYSLFGILGYTCPIHANTVLKWRFLPMWSYIWRAMNNPVPTLYGLIVVLLTFLAFVYIPLRFF